MGIEMSSERATCFRCGTPYNKRKGNFPVSYSVLNKGVGHTPICKNCINAMYEAYLQECGNAKDAVRQMCRKLDLYWSENLYELAVRKSTPQTLMLQYIVRTNTLNNSGKSYDDTLADEGVLWDFSGLGEFGDGEERQSPSEINHIIEEYNTDLRSYPITKEVIDFWGPGLEHDMYQKLEQRRAYWMTRIPDEQDVDLGMEAIIRQICSLELDINRDRAEGKSVDKNVNTLNTLLGSANWKPIQKKEVNDSSVMNPLGVWLYRYENEKPLPKTKKELLDVNKHKKNVFTWMGHVLKMLGKPNGYTKIYEEEIQKWRVEKPEYDDLSDEDMMSEVFEEEFGDDG